MLLRVLREHDGPLLCCFNIQVRPFIVAGQICITGVLLEKILLL